MYVDIEDIKKQVNVDFADDDSYISDLIEVSEIAITSMINTPLETYVTTGENPESKVLIAPLRHAVKLLVANLYENREPVSYGKAAIVPFTLNYLIAPYVKLT